MAPVVPVLIIDDAADAAPLARALVAGGLRLLEVTLRTPAAFEAIARIAGEVEGAVAAAGTVLNVHDLERAAEAGAKLAFTPGLTDFVAAGPIPVLPGVATASDIMRGLDLGLANFKFFPAVPAGGAPALTAFSGPFPDVMFCPTGGIDAHNAADFLALPNVLCVGGSWAAPRQSVRARDWALIEGLARRCAMLGQRGEP